MNKLICMAFAALSAVLAVAAGGESEDGVFVFTQPDESSFWHTATNNVIELPIWCPDGATSAALSVRGVKYARTYENLAAGTFVLTLPPPDSPEKENVYDLTLTFDDGTVRTARLGLVSSYGAEAEGTTRCVFDESGDEWKGFTGKAVLPVPAGTTALSVNGETVETGLDGAAGWFALKANRDGSEIPLVLATDGSEWSASVLGVPYGFLLLLR